MSLPASNSIEHITGNNGTLRGLDAASIWDLVGGSFQPTYTSGNSLTFDGFKTLQGGSDADEFSTSTPQSPSNLKGGAVRTPSRWIRLDRLDQRRRGRGHVARKRGG